MEHGEREEAGTGPAVEVRDLVKRYPKGRVNAVDGVSFAVTPGEVFGLLGPNGAGKTTTVGVLTTRVRPTGGAACVGGVDVAADPVRARRLVAVVPQRNNLDRSLSIRQNLLFHAAYHGVPTRRPGAAQMASAPRASLANLFRCPGAGVRVMSPSLTIDARRRNCSPPRAPSLKGQLLLRGRLLAEQRAEPERGRGRVVVAIVVEHHVDVPRALCEGSRALRRSPPAHRRRSASRTARPRSCRSCSRPCCARGCGRMRGRRGWRRLSAA